MVLIYIELRGKYICIIYICKQDNIVLYYLAHSCMALLFSVFLRGIDLLFFVSEDLGVVFVVVW